MMKQRMAISLGLLSLLGSALQTAEASGFANEDASAAGVGVANAMVAGVADVSAASYNPAAVAWLDGVDVQLNTAIEWRNASVVTATGMPFNAGNNYKVQGFHAIWMPHTSNIGASMALTRPFAAHNTWFGEQTNIEVDRLSLDVVYALSSTLAVAHGLDMYQSRIQMSQGAATFSGSDRVSFGINVGVNWKPLPFWQAGMLLRTGSKAKVTNGTQTVNLNLPETLTLGVSHDIKDKFRVEGDLTYTHWSRLKNLNVQGGAINHALALKSTVSLKTGLTYYWLPNTTFRMGYAYEQASNTVNNVQAAIMDQPGHRLSFGMGGNLMGIQVDFAYAYGFFANQTASAPAVFAGNYRNRQQTLAFSLSKKF
ncbi:MAG: outer membrane protein transport protein [Mariprofundaceae bacterium]|nr:outer membrane protein transport protein [Mariprofundaceae bacterium]